MTKVKSYHIVVSFNTCIKCSRKSTKPHGFDVRNLWISCKHSSYEWTNEIYFFSNDHQLWVSYYGMSFFYFLDISRVNRWSLSFVFLLIRFFLCIRKIVYCTAWSINLKHWYHTQYCFFHAWWMLPFEKLIAYLTIAVCGMLGLPSLSTGKT